MTMHGFIAANRTAIDEVIAKRIGFRPAHRINDEERRQWVLNDEPLYLWARREGVKV